MALDFLNPLRSAVRAPKNPLDRSTLVSILPKPVHEVKHTLFPGIFDIAPGTVKNPAVLVIGSSSWWRSTDPDMPIIEIPVYSNVVAKSVVDDYCTGLLACDMGDRMPGLFWVPGVFGPGDILTKFPNEIAVAHKKQLNWFKELVRQSDALWARSSGNPLAIPDEARLAARELNLQKDWMQDLAKMEMIKCPNCGTMINSEVPSCYNCKVIINETLFNSKKFKFAGNG